MTEYYEKTKHPDSEIDYARIWVFQHTQNIKRIYRVLKG